MPVFTDATITYETQIATHHLLQDFKLEQRSCVKTCEDKVHALKENLATFRKKKVPLNQFDNLKAEIDLLLHSVKEQKLCKNVFLKCCVEMQASLENLIANEQLTEESLVAMVSSLRAKFEREVKRYDKALPMYAERLTIMTGKLWTRLWRTSSSWVPSVTGI